MILLFTDIHFGLKLNSELFLDIALKNVKWIEKQIEDNKVKTIIFLGDWFHQRTSVSVNTLHKSYEALAHLASKVDKFYMIVGNHDSYYKNSTDVNSLQMFEQIKNLQVVDKITKVSVGAREFILAPWGFQQDEYMNLGDGADAAFGHFEPNGVKLLNRITEGFRDDLDFLTNSAPLVFSGHFHMKSEYETKNGKVIFVGSPSQQNWGDCGDDRGVYILNENDMSYKFIENRESPKFKKFLFSKIMEEKKLPPQEQVEGNFVKVVVDCQYKFETVQKLLAKLTTIGALTVEAEYYYSEKINSVINRTDEVTIKTNEDYIKEFVMSDSIEFPEGVDREKLANLALSIYGKAQDEAAFSNSEEEIF